MIGRVIWWSVNNRMLVLLVAAILLIGGLVYCSEATIDVFPEFSPPQVVVITEAPGLTAEQVESVVTLPLETTLNGTPGVVQVRSASNFGLSTITIVFRLGTPLNTARQLVSEKLLLVRARLGEAVGTPVMLPPVPPIGDIVKVGLTSSELSLMELRTIAEWDFRYRLLSVSGVSRVLVFGSDEKEYQVLINPDKLTSYGLTLSQVTEAVSKTNLARAAGFFLTKDRQLPIYGLTRAKDVDDLGNTVVGLRNGTPLLLKHLCSIEIASAPKVGAALINGKPGVYLYVSRQPNVDTIKLTTAVEAVLDDLKKQYGEKIAQTKIFRQADFIHESVNNVLVAIYTGGFLVLLVLLCFGINWRLSVVTLVAMPLSLIFAVALLQFLGATINTMTLGGLAIAIGEAVDDAVVDAQNVLRHLTENEKLPTPLPRLDVIKNACNEIRSSVLYSTLMVCLVFLPVFVLPGVEGRIFSPLGVAYMLTVVSSWLVAVLITPALCALFWGRRTGSAVSEKSIAVQLQMFYTKSLDRALKHRKPVLSLSVLAVICSLSLLPSMGQGFLPEFSQRDLILTLMGRTGQSLTATVQMGKTVTNRLIDSGQATAVGEWAGRTHLDDVGAGTNYSEFDIAAKPTDHGNSIDSVRGIVSDLPGCFYDVTSFITHRMNEVLSGGTRAQVAVKIFGPDLKELERISKRVIDVVKSTRGAVDVRGEAQMVSPHVVLSVNRAKIARYGLSVADVCDLLEVGFGGRVVSEVLEGQRLFKLRLWFDEKHRNSIELVKRTLIDTPSGLRLPLSELAEINIEDRPAFIFRENVARRMVVQANTKGRDLVGFVNELKGRINQEIDLSPGYYVIYSGQYVAQQEAARTMFWACLASIIGILILLRQAVGDWRTAFIIASNLPLAVIGGIVGIAVGGGTITVGSLIGFVSLFGISTRNAVLLVSEINRLISSGVNVDAAIRTGATSRFLPVVLTASMAGFGMLPLAILGGAGRELEQPLAIVITGGLVSSTVMSLFVIPVLYKSFVGRMNKPC
jgi:CzcA family heavy metal efflux pump